MKNKIKYMVAFVLLLIMFFVIKFFSGGFYRFLEELLPCFVLLCIVSVILMIVPAIIRIVSRKRIEYKKGLKICFFNSFILFAIFSFPNIINIIRGSDNVEMMTIDPVAFSKSLILVYSIVAIIYFFINMCFFVESKKKTE